jgi:hypothetical protein
MAVKPKPLSDRELRLECARLVMAFSSPNTIDSAERLFRYIRDGKAV